MIVKSLKRQLKSFINEFSLTAYKKLSPDGFPSGWDVASDIKRILGQQNIQVIFDVGANVGNLSLYFHKKFPQSQILSFEPIQTTFKNLEKNTSNFQNISCFNYALGNTNTSKTIQLNEKSQKNSLLDLSKNTNNLNIKSEVIEIKTIDDFCAERNLDKIDVLKTDTEGFDLQVLQGAEKLLNERKILFIISEVGFRSADQRHTSFSSLYEYLYPKGFRFYALYDLSYWYPYYHEGLIYGNALFINSKAIKNKITS